MGIRATVVGLWVVPNSRLVSPARCCCGGFWAATHLPLHSPSSLSLEQLGVSMDCRVVDMRQLSWAIELSFQIMQIVTSAVRIDVAPTSSGSAPSLLPLNRVAQSLCAAGACSLSEPWRLNSSLIRGEEQSFRCATPSFVTNRSEASASSADVTHVQLSRSIIDVAKPLARSFLDVTTHRAR